MLKIDIFMAKIKLCRYFYCRSSKEKTLLKRRVFSSIIPITESLRGQLFTFLSNRKKPMMMEIKLNTAQKIAPIESDTML